MSDPASAVRVVLVDHSDVVRQSVRALLESADGITVCGEAAGTTEAVDAARRHRPDVVVLGLGLADADAIEAGRRIRSSRPGTRLLVLTAAPEEDARLAVTMAGASGYLLKQPRGTDLVGAVRAVAGGERLISAPDSAATLDRARRCVSPEDDRLLGLVAEGATDSDIADELGLDTAAVRGRVLRMAHKLRLGWALVSENRK